MRLTYVNIIFLAAVVFCQTYCFAQVEPVLENDALRIVFSDSESGFNCFSIINKLKGNTRFVVPEGDALKSPGLWQMTLHNLSDKGKREVIQIDNKNCGGIKSADIKKTLTGDELTLQWKNITLGEEKDCFDVTATIALAPGAGASSWRIQFDNRCVKWTVDSTLYPILRTVCKKGTADVLLPTGAYEGTLHHNNTSGFNDSSPVGTPQYSLQLMAFNQGDAGLYVAAHDGQANLKRLILTEADQHAMFEVMAENRGEAGSDRLPSFPYVIAAYRGNWWTAAKMYRQWALQQKWAGKGWLATRTDLQTRHFLDIGFWIHANAWAEKSEAAEIFRTDMVEASKLFAPLKLAWHAYNWHHMMFDTEYPEFFPVKDGVGEDVKTFQRHGISVMPYINALIWDVGLDSFATTGKSLAIKKQNGDVTIYGYEHEHAPICPYTSAWQDVIDGLSKRLIDPAELDSDGIYFDQVGLHGVPRCYDASHGHPMGGGNQWTQGYRTMLDKITNTVGDDAYFTIEWFAESFIDTIHGFLIGPSERKATDVPLLQAIYSGYATSFGCFESKRNPLDTFAVLQGDSFVRGIMPGWIKLPFIHKKGKVDLAKKLALYRMAAKDFLVYGELVNEIQIEPKADNVVRTVYGPFMAVSTKIKEFSPIRGTLWRTYDGKSLGLVVMNMDSKPRRATFFVDTQQWLKKGDTKGLGIYRILPQGIVFEQLAASQLIERDIVLDAYEVLILAIRPQESMSKAELVTPVLTDKVTKRTATMAKTSLFDREMANRKLEITLENDLVESLYTSSIEAVLNIANNGNSTQKLQISWPDGTSEKVILNRKQNTTIKHKIQLTQNKAMTSKFEIGVKNGTFAKKIPLYVNLKAPLQVVIEQGQSMPSEVAATLKLSVQNNTDKVQSGTVEVVLQDDAAFIPSGDFKTERAWYIASPANVKMALPTDWQYKAGVDFKDLGAGQKVALEIECKAPYHVRETVAVITAKVDEYTATERFIVLKPLPTSDEYFRDPEYR